MEWRNKLHIGWKQQLLLLNVKEQSVFVVYIYLIKFLAKREFIIFY